MKKRTGLAHFSKKHQHACILLNAQSLFNFKELDCGKKIPKVAKISLFCYSTSELKERKVSIL